MYAIFDDISVALRHCTLCSYIDELVFVFHYRFANTLAKASKSFNITSISFHKKLNSYTLNIIMCYSKLINKKFFK